MVKAEDIKKLREMTGAGMLDCRKALEETKGDIDKAVDYLREKGVAKAAKKESRIAAEGLSKVFIDGNHAVMLEVNTETDFVSKNEKFLKFFDELGEVLLKSNVKTEEEALKLEMSDGTVEETLTSLIATIGEKISFRRFVSITKEADEKFGEYIHMGGRISALTVIKGTNEEVAKDVSMQLAAMNPKYITIEDISKEDLEREEKVIRKQIKESGKPEDIIDKMLVGRMNKFYKEVCLVEQAFIKDDKLSVKDYLKNNKAELVEAYRFEVGEGIEKKGCDFLSEVKAQING